MLYEPQCVIWSSSAALVPSSSRHAVSTGPLQSAGASGSERRLSRSGIFRPGLWLGGCASRMLAESSWSGVPSTLCTHSTIRALGVDSQPRWRHVDSRSARLDSLGVACDHVLPLGRLRDDLPRRRAVSGKDLVHVFWVATGTAWLWRRRKSRRRTSSCRCRGSCVLRYLGSRCVLAPEAAPVSGCRGTGSKAGAREEERLRLGVRYRSCHIRQFSALSGMDGGYAPF